MTGWSAFWNAYRRAGLTQATAQSRRLNKQSGNGSVATRNVATSTQAGGFAEWANDWDDVLYDVSF